MCKFSNAFESTIQSGFVSLHRDYQVAGGAFPACVSFPTATRILGYNNNTVLRDVRLVSLVREMPTTSENNLFANE